MGLNRRGWTLYGVGFACLLLISCGNNASGYDSPAALAAAYQQLHDAQDMDRLLDMVYEKGDKKAHRFSFQQDLQYDLRSVETRNLEPGELDQWLAAGIKPNLNPVAWLIVVLEVPGTGTAVSSTESQYLIGEKDQRFYIASAN